MTAHSERMVDFLITQVCDLISATTSRDPKGGQPYCRHVPLEVIAEIEQL